MNIRKYVFCLLAAAGLAACSTPSSVLEQAAHGISLTSQMELELKEFRRQESIAERSMTMALLSQQTMAATLAQGLRKDDLARQAVGDAASLRIVDNLGRFVQGLADSDAEAAKSVQATNNTMAKLLAPLPSTASAITDTQAKLADLGKELPWKVRETELKKMLDEVRANVKENKQKIEEAKAAKNPAAPVAPVASLP